MLSASTSMPCSSMARSRSATFVAITSTLGRFGCPVTFRPINAMASGTAQCACTSTVFTRLPLTTTSRRRGCACATPPPTPPCIPHATKAMPATAPVAASSMKSLRVIASSWRLRFAGRCDRLDGNAVHEVHASDARSHRGGHVVETKAVPLGHVGHADLALALAADDDHLVADGSLGHRGEVDPRVLERRRGHDGHGSPVHEHTARVEPVEPVG